MKRYGALLCSLAGLAAMLTSLICAFTAKASNATYVPVSAVLAMSPQELPRARALEPVLARFEEKTQVGLAAGQTSLPANAAIVHDAYTLLVRRPGRGFRAAAYTPGFVSFAGALRTPVDARLVFRGATLRVTLLRYDVPRIARGTHVAGWFLAGARKYPFALVRGSEALLDGVFVPKRTADALTARALVATVLDRAFFGTYLGRRPAAQLVLGPVTADASPVAFWRAVRLMQSRQVSYVLTVDRSAYQDEELAAIVRFAASHGALLRPVPSELSAARVPWASGDLGRSGDPASQLDLARALRFCNVCTVSAALDPQYVRFEDLSNYVASLQRLGYRFQGGL